MRRQPASSLERQMTSPRRQPISDIPQTLHSPKENKPAPPQIDSRASITIPPDECMAMYAGLSATLKSGKTVGDYFQERRKALQHHRRHGSGNRLETLLRGNDGRRSERFVEAMCEILERGKSFGDAAHFFPRVFEPQALAIFTAAERNGALPKALDSYYQFQFQEKEMRDKLMSALRYPAIVSALALALLFFASVWLVPAFAMMYEGLVPDSELPGVTRFLLGLSGFIKDNALIIGGSSLLVGSAWVQARRESPDPARPGYPLPNAVRATEARLLLRLPLIGRFVLQIDVLMFLRLFVLLRDSGETMTESFRCAAAAVRNAELREATEKAATAFFNGKPSSIADCLASAHPCFSRSSPLYAEIRDYETQGTLTPLLQYCEYLAFEIEGTRQALIGYVGPTTILLVGFMVAFLVYGLYAPLFDLIGKLAK